MGATSSKVKLRVAVPVARRVGSGLREGVPAAGRHEAHAEGASAHVAALPFTLRLVTASLTVPVTVSGVVFRTASAAGAVIVRIGGSVSRMPLTVAVPRFPAGPGR